MHYWLERHQNEYTCSVWLFQLVTSSSRLSLGLPGHLSVCPLVRHNLTFSFITYILWVGLKPKLVWGLTSMMAKFSRRSRSLVQRSRSNSVFFWKLVWLINHILLVLLAPNWIHMLRITLFICNSKLKVISVFYTDNVAMSDLFRLKC